MSGNSLANTGLNTRAMALTTPPFSPIFITAEPEGEHAGKPEGNLKGRFRRVERGIHNGGKHFHIAQKDEPNKGNKEGHSKKGYPDVVEYHCVSVVLQIFLVGRPFHP